MQDKLRQKAVLDVMLKYSGLEIIARFGELFGVIPNQLKPFSNIAGDL